MSIHITPKLIRLLYTMSDTSALHARFQSLHTNPRPDWAEKLTADQYAFTKSGVRIVYQIDESTGETIVRLTVDLD
ncbi:MAG: hypothetical protein AAF639_31265 [Chloroflexota bacterium]